MTNTWRRGAAHHEPAPERRATIADIAAAADVSKPTVSRVLNQRGDVAPATRRKVEQVAAELGYVPSAGARALRTGRHGALGLLLPSEPWGGLVNIVYGVAEEAAARMMHVMVYPLPAGRAAERQFAAKTLPHLPVDGLVALMPDDMVPHRGSVPLSGAPIVAFDDRGIRPGIPYVETTNREGVREAVGHLVAHGYRRIAFASGTSGLAFAEARYEGYLDGLRDAGLPHVPQRVLRGQADMPSDNEIRELLTTDEPDGRPDAVVAAWDEIATAVGHAAHELGLRLGRDIALIGFDDRPEIALMIKGLTTVHQPLREMGQTAVRLLLEIIEHGPGPANATVPTHLVIRDTCGPHAADGTPLPPEPR
ncbi:LacI family transcriptional regulator [Saccharopolyspora antimicrobica]|uniref:LacI family transcriptional regulator n=1 Tax=Saccharopolyspora antimicrobica TaxID=455193 RepID=A0A1I4SEQ2_9PSEU|nr:LacI family DNA-binding transcriptional regulator [Saccharopolyspora antimicrobica]RKT87709.1 LacI family transcriptional regulator [Saccharopolyspora antimicrobica]SFM62800.1 LacI family transcriptional regulator [Saccharopolyspora antimicrobica]